MGEVVEQLKSEVVALQTEVEELKCQLAKAAQLPETLRLASLGIHKYFQAYEHEVDPLALKILSWWFGSEYDGQNVGPEQYALWFGKSDDTDREFRQLFTDAVDLCAAGRFDDWAKHALGSVAIVILMDQCPRAIYRNTARSVAFDWKAISTTWKALDLGFDTKVSFHERVWFYAVLTHAEDLKSQNKCIALAEERLTGLQTMFHDMWIGAYKKHLYVIETYGRFPHRNRWLNRESSPEEEEFLQNPKYRFDAKMHFEVDEATGKANVVVVDTFDGRRRTVIQAALAKNEDAGYIMTEHTDAKATETATDADFDVEDDTDFDPETIVHIMTKKESREGMNAARRSDVVRKSVHMH